MSINATDVKKLRDRTGAGMLACKTALEEARGDFEEATTILRKKGLASAAKKVGRATREGLIGHTLAADHQSGILAEVTCESDFVARTDDFRQLVSDVLAAIEQAGDGASEAWLGDPSGPVQQRVALAIGKLGENMAVPRFVRYARQGHVGQYIHLGGKIGVQVEFAGVTPELAGRDELKSIVKEIAMQVASQSPTYVARSGVPPAVLEKERAIYRAQLENTGKPPQVIEKIVEGKLGSFYSQVVLLDQESIRDPKMKVADRLATAAKALGRPLTLTRFARLKVGETA